MSFKMYVFTNCVVICSLYLAIANAMVGPKVELARVGQFPWIVSIRRMNYLKDRQPEEDHICTGTLISKRDVLTLASCENEFKGYVCEVKMGSVDLREGTSFFVQWWMSFSKWSSLVNKQTNYKEKDAAIIRLSEKVHSSVVIAKRGNIPDSAYYGKTVQAAGFGCTFTEKHTRFLLTANLKILANKECEEKLFQLSEKKFNMHEAYLCATADPYVLLSRGDNGAPIIYDKKVIGIHKGLSPTLPDHNDPRKINLNLSVYYFKLFIEDTIHNF